MSSKTGYAAMFVTYRFTNSNGQRLSDQQRREMDDSMFELIGTWAQERGLSVEGGADFERLEFKPPSES